MNVDRIKLITKNMKHLVTVLEKELGVVSEFPDNNIIEMEDFQEMGNATSIPYSNDYDELY